MSFPGHTNISTIQDADPLGGRHLPRQLHSPGSQQMEDTGKVVVNRQFLELLAKESSHDEESRAQEGRACSMANRLQQLLGEDVSEGSRTPIPLAQQVWELTSTQNVENAEPPIRVAETVQDFFKRVSDPAEGIEEVPDTDSAESFEGECNSEVGDVHTVERAETMMERFRDVLHSIPTGDGEFSEQQHSRGALSGFSAHLQRVLQREKNRLSVLSKASSVAHTCEGTSTYITARILSRCREAQLTSCSCKVVVAPKCEEQGAHEHSSSNHVHVIFNTKDNRDLDLEVGSVVRINRPWREVSNAEGFGKIIICTYFSSMVETDR